MIKEGSHPSSTVLLVLNFAGLYLSTNISCKVYVIDIKLYVINFFLRFEFSIWVLNFAEIFIRGSFHNREKREINWQVVSWFYWYVPFRNCVFCSEITSICVLLVSFYLHIFKSSEDWKLKIKLRTLESRNLMPFFHICLLKSRK